jgi:predicted nucleic acid-binding protein
MLDRNGKKEIILEALTSLIGDNIGLAFELDPKPAEHAPAAVAARAHAAPSPARRTVPPPPSVPQDAGIRITPELRESLRTTDPLIAAICQHLGGEIVRVE